MLRISCCLAIAAFAVAFASPAHASFVVNTDSDEDVDSDGLCSLREAIKAVNAQSNYHDCISLVPGESGVTFAIAPNTGELHTIELGSGLPAITHAIGLDASQQTGTVCAPWPKARVQITNPLHLAIDGLEFSTGSDNSVVGGLALSGFVANLSAAVYVNSPNVAVGCMLAGTDASGSFAQPNYYGIYVGPGGQSALIGIADAKGWQPNLISGNSSANVFVTAGGSGSIIAGNYIGVDNTGLNAMTSGYGIYVQGAANVRVGVAPGNAAARQRNVIAVASNGVNSSTNVELDTVTDAVVAGNYIGVGVDGQTSVPIGSGSAITIFQTSRSLVGCDGQASWDACRNVIANPTGPAILNFEGSTDTAIVSNFVGVAADGVSTFGGSADVIGIDLVGADTLVARNRISAGSGMGIELNPNSSNATPVFLQQTVAGSGGATLDSSDNCVQGNGSGGVYTNNGATQTLTSFTDNWWGAADGPAPGGSGDFSSANVTASPYLSAPSTYCGFDRVFVAGFE